MSKEQITILEMVAEGRITVEEGEKLLEATSEPAPTMKQKTRVIQEDKVDLGDYLEDLGDQLKDLPDVALALSGLSGRINRGVRHRVRHMRVAPRHGDDVVEGNPGFDKLVKLGMYGISSTFLKELKEAGLKDLTFDEIIQFGMYGVSPSYVKEMKNRFGNDINYKQITKLSMYGIDVDFVDAVKKLGLNLSFKQIVKLGMYGITPEYIQEMADAGLVNFEDTSEESDADVDLDEDSDLADKEDAQVSEE